MAHRRQFSAFLAANCPPAPVIISALKVAQAFAAEAALDERRHAKLLVIVEELVANVLMHGADGRDVTLQFSLGLEEEGTNAIRFEIEDNGIAFDPRTGFTFIPAKADTEGGIGLELIKSWASDLTYHREGEHNRLTLRLE